ncbi:hypothetical protein IE81DRAFT_325442 [Ceraceosorus guamensis]|uniref:Uncharacterized protein n=1 Tax=Ceraceosorus guamensis TaxID=1522189 RepID=A0A316VSV8_9BASI|nr:hypothetical protein IE81DRAFT_325442 [Ceraceosorus guamensis]PWN40572.1 hypothetical protein IE81DRAFT_325442 [Ceraceosorus guamensis]
MGLLLLHTSVRLRCCATRAMAIHKQASTLSSNAPSYSHCSLLSSSSARRSLCLLAPHSPPRQLSKIGTKAIVMSLRLARPNQLLCSVDGGQALKQSKVCIM